MRPIRWLHISDLHLRESEVWSQDAVLAAMLDDIARRNAAGVEFDFVLVTGDLAYSGQDSEYTLVEMFLDDLVRVIGVTRAEVFCIPGNHDVDRNCQKMCFSGARLALRSETEVYSFLSNEGERETLLMRLQAFRRFHERCFPDQNRIYTEDGLAYVSLVTIDDIRIAVVGLNSAWLAEGGRSDHGQLLLGECQVTNVIASVIEANPHIVIGMAHHPFSLLNEFDRPPTQRRLEEVCQFYHCGHLHVPDASNVATQSGNCLTLAAGASFESRDSHNSYTIVAFDPLRAETTVTFVRYDPVGGSYSFESDRTFFNAADASTLCGIGELSYALEEYCPKTKDISHYLAALLVGAIADVPIMTDQGIGFGTVALFENQKNSDLRQVTLDFLSVGNALRFLFGDRSLGEILAGNGRPVKCYANALVALAEMDPNCGAELSQRNEAARKFAGADRLRPFGHTLVLFQELRDSGDWDALRTQAERHIATDDPVVRAHAKRMLALCLGQSVDRVDRMRAVELYRELVDSPEGEAADFAGVASLLKDDGELDQAKATLLRGIEAFPESIEGFMEVGMGIVEETGDRTLRDTLRTLAAARRTG